MSILYNTLISGGTKDHFRQLKYLILPLIERPSISFLTTGFTKLHIGLVVLVKKMSVLINFPLQNTNLVSFLSKICPNFAGHV